MSETPPTPRFNDPRLIVLIGAVAVVVLALWLATIGTGAPDGAIAGLIQSFLLGASLTAPWLIGAAGLGRLLAGLWRTDTDAEPDLLLQTTAGAMVCLFLAHLMGMMGLFSGGIGRTMAWLPCVTGTAILLHQWRGRRPMMDLHAAWFLPVASPVIAMLVTAACIAPGFIWSSEARQFDTLAYHLQLPKEWLASGTIQSLQHNVYSHLPSYMEAGYTQLAAMSLGAEPRPAAGAAAGVYAAQLLHLCFAILAALHVRRVIDAIVGNSLAGVIGGCSLLAAGWVTVAATCAYNEMVVLAGFAAAIGVARRNDLSSVQRGLLVALLTAGAVAAKPTALYMVAFPSVALLVAWSPSRTLTDLARLLIPGAFVAMIFLAPWLIRNAMATGNPVFPAATDLFGSGHWMPEQVARWRGAHSPDGTIADRLHLLVTERGMGHHQWFLFFPLVGVGAIVALLWRRTRAVAGMLVAALAFEVAARLLLEHQQSRFLLPLAVPGAVLIGLGISRLLQGQGDGVWRRRFAYVPLLLLVFPSISNFLEQNWIRFPDRPPAGGPSEALIAGARALNGSISDFAGERPLESMDPISGFNATLGDGDLLYLVGESRALYFTVPVSYHSTWDSALMGEAIEASDGTLDGAIRWLAAQGVTHLLVNSAELERLRSDGWYDPRVTQDVIPTTPADRAILCLDITRPDRPSILPFSQLPTLPPSRSP